MKMKGFSNPRIHCSFKFEFLNLPKRLRELSVEASERHFPGFPDQIQFTAGWDFYKASKPAQITNVLLSPAAQTFVRFV